MSCSSGCGCSSCVVAGMKLDQFADVDAIALGQQFVLADNTLMTVQQLVTFLSFEVNPPTAVTEITGDYTVLDADIVIRSTGTNTITVPTRSAPVVIYSASGTATLVCTIENETNTLTIGQAYKLYPFSGGYFVA